MRRHAWADDEGRGGQEACGTCVEHRGADHLFQLHNRGVFAPQKETWKTFRDRKQRFASGSPWRVWRDLA